MSGLINYIILRRKRLGISQKDFGVKLGVSERHVQRWEAGDAQMKVKDLEESFKVLGVKQVVMVPGEGVINFGI